MPINNGDIRKVKTIDDLNAEKEQSNKQATENELKERKEAAKRDVQNSVAGKHYRTTQKAMIDEAMEDYFKLIDEQMTIEDYMKTESSRRDFGEKTENYQRII